ncbi:hypothetical protein [Yinghuangia seranimata]|uniref:hypothetical protein n=1 Tax=Yinghuangia seranimata TaxID=408067 RepID=UPI00248C34F3|nr:hypothetical protein [Yinghuangia seranimata]MDI2130694.1 hypothetical protein [Yinghuangia seranimata]
MELSDQGRHVPLWFELPEGFVAVDLDEDPETRDARVAEMTARLAGDAATPDQVDLFVAGTGMGLARMRRAGLTHMSSLLATTEDGGLTTAMLTVMVTDSERPNPRTFARDNVGAFGDEGPSRQVGVVDLPCGEAIAVFELLESTTKGIMFGVAEDVVQCFAQAQVIVAFPQDMKIAVFTLATPDLENCDDLLAVFAEICKTITFTRPAERPDGTADPAAKVLGNITSVLG